MGGAFGTTNQIITSSLSTTIGDLSENALYQVRVIATRIGGAIDASPSSVEPATTDTAITTPSQVGGANSYPVGDSTGASIYVEWDIVANADGYNVQWGTTSGSVDSTNQLSVTATNATISSGLLPTTQPTMFK